MNNKFLSLLGMARRANMLSQGRDASVAAVKGRKAKICFISSNASQRLEKEMRTVCEGRETLVIRTPYTMAETGFAVGNKTVGVITVNDEGFKAKMLELLNGQDDLHEMKEDDSHDN